MNRKAISGIMLTLLLMSMLTLTFNIQPIKASGTIYITADGSVEGTDKITSVDNITYTFTDNINDSIVVQRSNIIINGMGYTLQGNGSGNGFDLTSVSNVTIKNTAIRGFYGGIYLSGTLRCNIFQNHIEDNGVGIRLYMSSNPNTILENNITANTWQGILIYESSNCCVFGNNIRNNENGVELFVSSSYNNVSGNNVIANSGVGICLSRSSSYNNVSRNNVTGNSYYGIYLCESSNYNSIVGNNVTSNQHHGIYSRESSSFNIVQGNTITSNTYYGTYFWASSNCSVSGNTITDNAEGICFDESSNCSISGNIVKNNGVGIRLSWSSNYSIVSENNIEDNSAGIELIYSSNYNRVLGNTIENSSVFGIGVIESSYNSIFHNSFMNNTKQVHTYNSVNVWDNDYPSGGNYWNDYTGIDSNSDGIGDTPYVIDENNTDNYPLMGPWTSIGENVTVAHATGISLTFANVTSSGITTVNATQSGPDPPSGFKLAIEPPIYYDINTTANYSGIIKLAIPYDDTGLTEEEENGLRLMQWNETLQQWINITTYVDTENNIIYGETSHLSMFTVIAPLIHNIAITNVTPSKTVVGQGYSVSINVTIKNWDYIETFNVSAFYDDTIITLPDGKNYTTTTLTSGNSTTLTLTWNTTDVARGNYTIKAEAAQILGETDLDDNTLSDGTVTVTWLGDLDADFDVDQFDYWYFCSAFIDYYKPPFVKDPLCDFDEDCDIDQFDYWTFCGAFIDYYKT